MENITVLVVSNDVVKYAVLLGHSFTEKPGKSMKLAPKFQGIYRIVKVLNNDRFIIEDTPLTR